MANEIRLSGALTVKNGNLDERVSFNFQADQAAAAGPYPGSVNIGTSEETVDLSAELSAGGLCAIKNEDATNFLDVGIATGSYFLKVLPGETYVVRLKSTTLYLKADTAAVQANIKAFSA